MAKRNETSIEERCAATGGPYCSAAIVLDIPGRGTPRSCHVCVTHGASAVCARGELLGYAAIYTWVDVGTGRMSHWARGVRGGWTR